MITSRLDEPGHIISLAIANAKEEITLLSEKKVNELFYGHTCSTDINKRIDDLLFFTEIATDEQLRYAYGGGCLCKEELLRFTSNYVVLFEEGARAGLTKDDSGLPLWTALNPSLVPLEKWEEAARQVVGQFSYELTVTPVECAYEATFNSHEFFTTEERACEVATEFTAKSIECDTSQLSDIDVSFKEACEVEFNMLTSDLSCKTGFDLYYKTNNCHLDLNQYMYMRSCDLSFNIIRTVLRTGCSITVNQPVTTP